MYNGAISTDQFYGSAASIAFSCFVFNNFLCLTSDVPFQPCGWGSQIHFSWINKGLQCPNLLFTLNMTLGYVMSSWFNVPFAHYLPHTFLFLYIQWSINTISRNQKHPQQECKLTEYNINTSNVKNWATRHNFIDFKVISVFHSQLIPQSWWMCDAAVMKVDICCLVT